MARPRNEQQRDLVTRAAYRVFLRKGYTAASYSDIAAEAGIDRSLVQHYAPRKQPLITSFMDRALTLAEEQVHRTGAGSGGEFVTLYRTGQVYFSFLLHDSRMRDLTLDVASHRDITSAVVFLSQEWAFAHLRPEHGAEADVADDFAMAVGGAYEVLYRHLRAGTQIDVPRLTERVLSGYLGAIGIAAGRFAPLRADALEPDVVEGLVRNVLDGVVGGATDVGRF
jgi:AcrR family transcriptional regulator